MFDIHTYDSSAVWTCFTAKVLTALVVRSGTASTASMRCVYFPMKTAQWMFKYRNLAFSWGFSRVILKSCKFIVLSFDLKNSLKMGSWGVEVPTEKDLSSCDRSLQWSQFPVLF